VPLVAPVSAAAVAVDASGAHLAAVNPDSGSITLIDHPSQGLQAAGREVPVGADPRTVSFTPDGVWVLVTNYGSGTVSFVSVATGQASPPVPVGSRPYGVVAGTRRAYVSLAGRPEVVALDLATRAVVGRLLVADFPTGLALSRDQASLYVSHLYTSTVTLIDTASFEERLTLSGDAEANLSQFIALSPDGTRAYLPRTDSLSAAVPLAYNTTVRPEVTVLDTTAPAVFPARRLDLAQVDRPVNLPFAAAVSPDGATLYVANAGSDDVSVIDLASGRARAHLAAGRNPRGLALAPGGGRLFVDNVLDGSLDVFDTTTLARLATWPLTQIPLPPDVLAGQRLFNSALAPMSAEHWLSCATCHLDGGADGRTWAGFPDGPRNTPALFGVSQTRPLHWDGNLDELQDTELTIRAIQGGAGLIDGQPNSALGAPNAGRSAALDTLAAYLASLAPRPSPYAPATPEEAAAVQRGQYAFQRWGCAVCHPAPLFTDRQLHLSGIGNPALERNQPGPLPRFDTPALAGVWATAPYFHDGSAATLRDVLFSRNFHNMGPAMDAGEPEDLIAYMRSLP
jgi:YVTN family beta-propeller protein